MYTIDDLVEEYKGLTKNCYQVDYSNKKALKKNNDSVKRMYEIIETVKNEFAADGILELASLLDDENYRTNLWIATQLLENVTLDKQTEEKAFRIVEKVAKGDDILALGYRYWICTTTNIRHCSFVVNF